MAVREHSKTREKSAMHNSLPPPATQLAQALRIYAGIEANCLRIRPGIKGGTDNALDNLRDSLDLVVGRRGFELHAWRFYSSAARDSAGGVAH